MIRLPTNHVERPSREPLGVNMAAFQSNGSGSSQA
jgi:hypothetical protein